LARRASARASWGRIGRPPGAAVLAQPGVNDEHVPRARRRRAQFRSRRNTAILDAEALAFNPLSEEFLPFQETTRRRRKHGIGDLQAELPIKAMVFDMMYLNGEPLLDKPLHQRIDTLVSTIKGNDVLQAEKGVMLDDPERLEAMFEDALERGLEGLVVKRIDSTYQAGARQLLLGQVQAPFARRTGRYDRLVSCSVTSWSRQTRRAGRWSAACWRLRQGQRRVRYRHQIGTGLGDEQWREVAERAAPFQSETRPARVRSTVTPSVWVEPKIVLEVLADEITKSPNHTAGYALRFPRVIRFRDADKRAEDATTLQEVIELFQHQPGYRAGAA